MNKPQKCSNDLERSMFANKFKVSFVCILEDVRPSNVRKCLKTSEVTTSVPKNIYFLKILNFVQSFVECKVSLADGKYNTRTVSLCYEKKLLCSLDDLDLTQYIWKGDLGQWWTGMVKRQGQGTG
jgi:hypothetical protein